jgi:hypothetical protein
MLAGFFGRIFAKLGRIIRPPLKTAKDQKQQDARHPDFGADISAGFFQIWAG